MSQVGDHDQGRAVGQADLDSKILAGGSGFSRPTLAAGLVRFGDPFGQGRGVVVALVAAAREGDQCKAVVRESTQALVEDRTLAGIKTARVQFETPEQFERLRKWHSEK